MINDITTDMDAPPQFVSLKTKRPANDYSYPSDFGPTQKVLHPEVVPLRLKSGPQKAYTEIGKLARQQRGWTIIAEDSQAFRLEAEARTLIFRFVDDVVIEVRGASQGSVVQMRSKSRQGKSDLGANARRIVKFLTDLNRRLG